MIKLGNSNIVGIRKGDVLISKIYKGVNLLYSSTMIPVQDEGSYLIYGCQKKLDNQAFEATGLNIVSHSLVNDTTNKYKVVFDGKVSSIGDGFLNREVLGSYISTIEFYNFDELETIGDKFLYKQTSLSSLDLSEFANVYSIGDYFLSSIIGLTSLDFSPMINLTTIGDEFLGSCNQIKTLQLPPNVETIGETFLNACKGLTTLDLTPLANTTSIGYLFLNDCTRLKTFIIDYPDKPVLLPLEESWTIPDVIYVNDEYLNQYKLAIDDFADLFVPLSEKP